MTMNSDLRVRIAQMIKKAGEGHIPSSYSIVDIIDHLYANVLNYTPGSPNDEARDYFVLSKGHGCAALYAVLEKFDLITKEDIENYSTSQGILGGHPDATRVPVIEASTGSLGHGFPTALGIALGLKIQKRDNRVYCLMGDGECHEGTIWESANVAANLKLDNLCGIVDWNGSAAQLMSLDDLPSKWRAFGWEVHEIDGHDDAQLTAVFDSVKASNNGVPKVVIAKTVKGKGVSFVEGHGKWHHRIPDDAEMAALLNELQA